MPVIDETTHELRVGRPKKGELHPKQELFCQEYLKDYDAVNACRRAGYSEAKARKKAYLNLRNETILNRINELNKQRFRRLAMDADDVLREWAMIGTFDIRELFNENGTMKAPHELSDVAAQVVSGLKIKKTQLGGIEKTEVEYKLNDKHTALTNVAKKLNMFDREDGEVGTLGGLIDRLDSTVGPPMLENASEQ